MHGRQGSPRPPGSWAHRVGRSDRTSPAFRATSPGAQAEARGGVEVSPCPQAGSPAVGAINPAQTEQEGKRARGSRVRRPCRGWRAARPGALPGGAEQGVERELLSPAHSHLSAWAREVRENSGLAPQFSPGHLFPCAHAPFSLSQSLGTGIEKCLGTEMKALLRLRGSAAQPPFPRPSHLWVVDLEAGRGWAEGAFRCCL